MSRAPGMTSRGATGDGKPTTSGTSSPSVSRTAHIEAYLCDLIARCAESIPLIDELSADDLDTPRGTASIARAALAHLLDGQPEAIQARLRDELANADLIARWRIRMAGLDVWAAGFDPDVMGVDSHGRTLTWARRANLTPIAELRRLRTYEPETV
jgi:hypothetical protein